MQCSSSPCPGFQTSAIMSMLETPTLFYLSAFSFVGAIFDCQLLPHSVRLERDSCCLISKIGMGGEMVKADAV